MPIADGPLIARKESSRRGATLSTLAGSTAGTFIVTIQAAVLIPLYISHVGPRLYGAWLASGDFLVWMQTFDLGLPNLMIQRIAVAYAGRNDRNVSEWLGTGMAMLACVSALIAAAGIGISFLIPRFFGLGGAEADQLRQCFQMASLAAGLNLFSEVFFAFSRAVQDTTFMNVTRVVATLGGFAVSFGAVLSGLGLWALPLGLTVRAALALTGGMIFMLRRYGYDVKRYLSFSKAVAHEFAAIAPATTLGGLSYSLMTQSDTALVGILRGPELATVYNITRKLMDACRGLVDQIAAASYGGFAHLIGSPDRGRALQVYAEIRSVRLWLAISAAAAFMAVNGPLIRLWVGGKMFGGPALTIFLGLQMIVGGESYLINYLYRAAVSVQKGSLALVVEALGRSALAVAFLLWLGLPGLALGAVVAGSAASFVVLRWTTRELSIFAKAPRPLPARTLVARAFVLSAAVFLCIAIGGHINSWLAVVLVASTVGISAIAALLCTDPNLSAIRIQINSWLGPRLRFD